MVNTARGEVEIILGDLAYNLRPTFEAMTHIESNTEMSVLQLAEMVSEGKIALQHMVIILECGIKAVEQDVPSSKMIGEAIMGKGVGYYLEVLAQFLNMALTGVPQGCDE